MLIIAINMYNYYISIKKTGQSSVVELLPGMCEALGSTPGTGAGGVSPVSIEKTLKILSLFDHRRTHPTPMKCLKCRG